MAAIGTAQIDNMVKRAVTAARLTEQGREFVRAFWDHQTLPRQMGSTLHVPKLSEVDVFALTEGVDMVQQQTITDSETQITPSEIGSQVLVTRDLVETASEDVRARFGTVMGRGHGKQRERDIMALFAGFDVDLGAAGNAFDHDDIGRGVSNIEGEVSEPNDEAKTAFIHPHHAFDIAQDLTEDPNSASETSVGNIPAGMSQDLYRDHFVGRLHGAAVVKTSLMSVDANTDAVAAVAVARALIVVDFRGFAIDPQWDASARSWELNATEKIGQSEYQGTWGLAITADASPQT
jgi:hypothetical protein